MAINVTSVVRSRRRWRLSVPLKTDARLPSQKFTNPPGFSVETETGMNFNYTFTINRWSLRLLGLWPLDTGFSSIVHCNINFTILFICLLSPVVQLPEAENLTDIINRSKKLVPFLPLLMRFILIKLQTKDLRIILDSMIIDWANYRYLPKQYRRIMDCYARRGRLFTIISLVFIMLSVIGEISNVSEDQDR